MKLRTRPTELAGVVATLLASTCTAGAHPHVFAEAQLNVSLSADKTTVKTLRHLWRFDELFSSTVTMEFDKNSDLQLDAAEMRAVSETIYASLADYNYFQIVTVDGKDVAMKAPASLSVQFDNGQLVVSFESEPKTPLALSGKVDFGVYDPTFYTAIDFVTDDKIAVDGLPSSCERTVLRPSAEDAIAQNQSKLTDAFFNDPTGTNMAKIFATKLELNCKAG